MMRFSNTFSFVLSLSLVFNVGSVAFADANKADGLSAICAGALTERDCIKLSCDHQCHWAAEKCQVHQERVALKAKSADSYSFGVKAAAFSVVTLVAAALFKTHLKRVAFLAMAGLLFASSVMIDQEAKDQYLEEYLLAPCPKRYNNFLDAKDVGYPTETYVFEKNVITRLALSKSSGKRPLVILLHGSDGSLIMMEDSKLTKRGYHTLGVNYFYGAPWYKGPRTLAKIQLENIVEQVAKQIEAHRDVIDEEKVGIMGVSKGGELTLLLASLFPNFKFALSVVPSHVVMQDLDFEKSLLEHGSSWSLNGQELPFMPFPLSSWETLRCFATFNWANWNKPFLWITQPSMRCRELHDLAFTNKEVAAKAAIKVENINGPLIVMSGTTDQCWPSDISGDLVMKRLDRANFPHPRFHMRLDGDHFVWEKHYELALDGVDAMMSYLETGSKEQFEEWTQRAQAVVAPSQLTEREEL